MVIPTPWNRGDALSASHLDESRQAIEQIVQAMAGSGGGGAGGRGVLGGGGSPRFRLGKIVTEGPDGADDLGLSSYWVQFVSPSNADTETRITTTDIQKVGEDKEEVIVRATNLQEWVVFTLFDEDTHDLPEGTLVLLFPIWTHRGGTGDEGPSGDNPSAVEWVFSQAPHPETTTSIETIGSTGETEAADTTVVSEATASKQIIDTRLVRIAYDDTGDEILYGYYRDYIYMNGLLSSISAETRVEIDAPEDCS